MMGAFDSVSGIPFSDVNLLSRSGHAPKWSPDSSTSEVTTIQLEFRDLSRLTGNILIFIFKLSFHGSVSLLKK